MIRRRLALHWVAALLLLPGCAALTGQDAVRVQVVDLEPLEGESLELRFMCVLRVQNPNDTDLAYSGVALDLQVRGNPFASGVADVSGTVPRFGEVLVRVPVSASALNLARVVIGLYMAEERPKVDYRLRGRIGNFRFESRGEITLPVGPGPAPDLARYPPGLRGASPVMSSPGSTR
jgi:LEA14-like dessication related protein